MTSTNQPSSWFQSSILGVGSIWLVACAGIALSIATYWVTNHQLTTYKQQDFEWAGQNRFRAFQKEMGDSLSALEELRTLLIGVPEITRANFQISSIAIMSSHKEILSFAWIPHESDNKKIKYIQNSGGASNWWSWEDMSDVQSNLKKASKSSEMVATVVKLRNQQDTGTLFAVILALFPDGFDPQQSQIRQLNPIGYIAGIYNLNQIVTASIDPLEPRGIDVWIQDVPEANLKRTLYRYDSRLKGENPQVPEDIPAIKHNLKIVDTVNVANHEWTFTALANPLFKSSQAFNEGPGILLIEGFLFTVVLILYLFRLQSEMRKRQRVSLALKESEERFRALLDHSPDTIMTINKAGEILFMNRPFPNSADAQKVGANFIDLLPITLHRKFQQSFNSALAGNVEEDIHFSMPDLSWWDARLIPIDLNKKEVKIMLIISDVTKDRVLHAQALRNARLASLGVLAASVAHEVNNPNSAIQFNNSILMRTWSDIPSVLHRYSKNINDFSLGGMPAKEALEAIPRLMAGIERSTSRIKKIVGNLKHMARQDKGGMDQEINMGEVIQAAISILQNQIKKYTDFCHLDHGGDLPAIRGNAQQLEQVIINILLNALQSLPDRSRRVLLTTSVDDSKENILITIHDEGVGMEEETIKSVLDPFFTTKESTGGTGLGLSISSDIINNHGGKISFDSRVGEGTLVTIKLPIIPSILTGLQT
ncbi:MAG: PAS domain S-box protein [Magnetococcales bacterium]|nr:PAS domain S-box protein [Magnetococcales bacterium]